MQDKNISARLHRIAIEVSPLEARALDRLEQSTTKLWKIVQGGALTASILEEQINDVVDNCLECLSQLQRPSAQAQVRFQVREFLGNVRQTIAQENDPSTGWTAYANDVASYALSFFAPPTDTDVLLRQLNQAMSTLDNSIAGHLSSAIEHSLAQATQFLSNMKEYAEIGCELGSKLLLPTLEIVAQELSPQGEGEPSTFPVEELKEIARTVKSIGAHVVEVAKNTALTELGKQLSPDLLMKEYPSFENFLKQAPTQDYSSGVESGADSGTSISTEDSPKEKTRRTRKKRQSLYSKAVSNLCTSLRECDTRLLAEIAVTTTAQGLAAIATTDDLTPDQLLQILGIPKKAKQYQKKARSRTAKAIIDILDAGSKQHKPTSTLKRPSKDLHNACLASMKHLIGKISSKVVREGVRMSTRLVLPTGKLAPNRKLAKAVDQIPHASAKFERQIEEHQDLLALVVIDRITGIIRNNSTGPVNPDSDIGRDTNRMMRDLNLAQGVLYGEQAVALPNSISRSNQEKIRYLLHSLASRVVAEGAEDSSQDVITPFIDGLLPAWQAWLTAEYQEER